jgi:hypothetical protein
VRLAPLAITLPLALAACVVYGKVQNPSPAEDLGSSLRIESVLRASHTFDGTPALRVRIWATPPKGMSLVLADTGIVLYTEVEPAGRVASGELRDDSNHGTGRTRELRVPGGTQQRMTAFLPLPDDRLRRGARFGLVMTWRLVPDPAPGIGLKLWSREYAIRVQRTNYGLALGIGWLLGGTAVAAAGP